MMLEKLAYIELSITAIVLYLISSHFSTPNLLLISFSRAELTNPYCRIVTIWYDEVKQRNARQTISQAQHTMDTIEIYGIHYVLT